MGTPALSLRAHREQSQALPLGVQQKHQCGSVTDVLSALLSPASKIPVGLSVSACLRFSARDTETLALLESPVQKLTPQQGRDNSSTAPPPHFPPALRRTVLPLPSVGQATHGCRRHSHSWK